ncbi:hypothetical protein DVH24_009181 [Malus domestica]|uniref:Uncharacterized protein n=1 Tax=Malus domestica TaxID=3750 RepID=A0A498JP68_MALDO|nr:hypothetical protein DVH24_009181 [Malus domestica]
MFIASKLWCTDTLILMCGSMPDSLAREAEPRNPSGNGETAGHGRMFQVRLSHVYGRLQFWHQAFSNPTQRRHPPAVNQVEMNPPWQKRKLRDFSNERNSVYRAPQCNNAGLDYTVLEDLAAAKGKTLPQKLRQINLIMFMQIILKSIAQQGASVTPTSFNMERMKLNLDIFVWELSEDETNKKKQIPQRRL